MNEKWPSTERVFDYLVIGGGTAGAVIAKRLSERTDLSIGLIEAGPNDEGNEQVLEVSNWPYLLHGEFDYSYPITEQTANSDILISRARVLGGCSSHNNCLAYVPPDYDFELWERAGALGWGAKHCQPFFSRVKTQVGFNDAPDSPLARAFIKAGTKLGLPERQFDGHMDQVGVGFSTFNTNGPYRRSSSVAYLHPLSDLPDNLTVYLNTAVQKILFDTIGTTAIGVRTQHGAIFARREVIVTCGAIDSPKLLMLSGIGPAQHLVDTEIPIRADLPGVGSHLIDHPEAAVIFETFAPLDHPIGTDFTDAVALANVSFSDRTVPDLILWLFSAHFDELTLSPGGSRPNAFSISPDVARAVSEGTVRLASSDPADNPLINLNYFSDTSSYDKKVMLEGIRLARQIGYSQPLAPWVKREIAPGSHIQTDEEIIAYFMSTVYTAHHVAGTCRMGASNNTMTVVDPELRVLKISGLRVADASVFPTMIGANPCITTMMIGERCADFILRSL